MPSFLRRIWNFVRGKSHAVLDRLEDPEEQLAVFVSDLNGQVQDLQRSVASAIADEKRLYKQLEGLRHKASEWEERAVAALEHGDEELARTAALQQQDCEAEAVSLESSWQTQKQATTQLKESLKLARSRMDEARRKYNLLLAQYKSAQTRKQIQSTLNGVGVDSPLQLLEQLEDKIRHVEAEAEAELAMSAEAADVDVEARFHQLDAARRGDAALDRIKARVAERQLSAGGSGDAAQDRVDQLKRSLDG